MGIKIASCGVHDIPGIKIAHPAVHFGGSDFLRFTNKRRKDSRFMVSCGPEFQGQGMIFPDAFGERMKYRG